MVCSCVISTEIIKVKWVSEIASLHIGPEQGLDLSPRSQISLQIS